MFDPDITPMEEPYLLYINLPRAVMIFATPAGVFYLDAKQERYARPPVPGLPSPQDLLQHYRRAHDEVIEIDDDGRIVCLSPELRRQVQAPFN